MWVEKSAALLVLALLAIACGGKSVHTIGGGEAGSSSGCDDTMCDGECVDTSRDRRNCGECGFTCGPGEDCEDGRCAGGGGCELPTVACNGECVDTRFSRDHCGSCNYSCGFDQTCQYGECILECPFGQCGGVCVDLGSDPSNCGGCGYACGPAQFCAGGLCMSVCNGPFAGVCDGICVDLSSDPFNCGFCGRVCEPRADIACFNGECTDTCPNGNAVCFDQCVDTQNDSAHCGFCGNLCPPNTRCQGGQCLPVCPMGTLCGMECVDTSTNPNHCGGCFAQCGPNDGCLGGVCSGRQCGNRVLDPGEEADPPPGPVPVVPLGFGTCRFDFSRINQWYCNGSCGNWGGGNDCDQGDADAFCKLKMDNPRSTALTYSIVNAREEPGVCCPPPSFPPGSLGCTALGTLTSRGVELTVSVHPTNLFSTHQGGKVITNLMCTDP